MNTSLPSIGAGANVNDPVIDQILLQILKSQSSTTMYCKKKRDTLFELNLKDLFLAELYKLVSQENFLESMYLSFCWIPSVCNEA